jgi:hypothetical protein
VLGALGVGLVDVGVVLAVARVVRDEIARCLGVVDLRNRVAAGTRSRQCRPSSPV